MSDYKRFVDDDDALIEAIFKSMGCDANKPARWREQIYTSGTGAKMITGYICTKCGKHSYSKTKICDGCNSNMPI